MLRIVYTFAVTCTLSQSFGLALINFAQVLLLLISIIYLIRMKDLPTNRFDYFIAFFLLSLLISAVISNNPIDGIHFVLFEFRELWAAVFISSALAISLSISQIVQPMILGLLVNFFGTLILTLQNYFHFEVVKRINDTVGVEQTLGRGGMPYLLNGKFTQSIIMIFSMALFCNVILNARISNWKVVVAVVAYTIFSFWHMGFLVGARSAIATSMIFVLIIIVVGYVLLPASRGVFFLVGFGLLAFFVSSVWFTPHLTTLFNEVLSVSGIKQQDLGSASSRLFMLYSAIWYDDINRLVGVGAGDIFMLQDRLFSQGLMPDHFFSWRDFHSDWIWVFFLGGTLSLLSYLGMCIYFIYFGLKHLFDVQDSVRHSSNFIGIGLILLVFGLFNTVMLNSNESSVLFCLLVVCLSLQKGSEIRNVE